MIQTRTIKENTHAISLHDCLGKNRKSSTRMLIFKVMRDDAKLEIIDNE
jgi:hypothetical protein